MRKLAYLNMSFSYRTGSKPGCCALRIFTEKDKQPVVIASELARNPGPSITNAAEYVAKAAYDICLHSELDGVEMGIYYIEHYGPFSYDDGDRETEYSHVLFSFQHGHFSCPEWSPISNEAMRYMLPQLFEAQEVTT